MTTDADFVEGLDDRTVEEVRDALAAGGVEPVNRNIRAFVEGWETAAKTSMQAVGVIRAWVVDDGTGERVVRVRTDIHPYTPAHNFPVVMAVDTFNAVATGLDGETAQAYMLGWGRGLLDREGPT